MSLTAAATTLQAGITPLAREAARWFARMARAPADHPDRGRFEAWLTASPLHAAEYARFTAVWDDFDSSARLERLTHGLEAQRAQERARRQSRRGVLRATALGIATLGLAGLFGWRLQGTQQTAPLLAFTRQTGLGQSMEQQLPDGSRLTLAPDTELAVRLYPDRREVDVLRGEAIFDVTHDPERPFIVRSAAARVLVLGTRFVVARGPEERVRVSVLRGRVRVEAAGAAQPNAANNALILLADEVAEVSAALALTRVDRKAGDAVAWQTGTLVFNGDRLTDVAQRLSRFGGVTVTADGVVGHPARITAVVQLRDTKAFLRSLPRIADVRVVEAEGIVRLEPR